MRRLRLIDLQKELRAKGIPELAKELKARTGYDATARKRRKNPREAQVLKNAVRPR